MKILIDFNEYFLICIILYKILIDFNESINIIRLPNQKLIYIQLNSKISL